MKIRHQPPYKPRRERVPALWVYAPKLRNRARKAAMWMHWYRMIHVLVPSRSEEGQRFDAMREGRSAGKLFRLRELAYDARPYTRVPRDPREGRWPIQPEEYARTYLPGGPARILR